MKNLIRVFAMAALVCAFVPIGAAQVRAQDGLGRTNKTQLVSTMIDKFDESDKLVVKFRDVAAFSMLDAAATTQATQAAQAAGVGVGVEVTPIHTLSAQAMKVLNAKAGVALSHVREMAGDAHVLRLPTAISEAEAQAIADKLNLLPEVEFARPAFRVHIMSTDVAPDDPQYSQQWHYSAPVTNSYGANLPTAWDVITGSTSVYIAVIDTGIRFDHPDMAGRTVVGYDFVSDAANARDGNGYDNDATDMGDWVAVGDPCYSAFFGAEDSSWHGTHVAGTIGAASNNAIGVAGINWVSKIVPVRALARCGGDDPDILDAIYWSAGLSVPGVPANPTPARVINMSLGGNGVCRADWQRAINAATAKGTLVVAAAGNSAGTSANSQTPGSCANVLTVASTNRNGSRASYSSTGSSVEVSGPGGETSPTESDGVLSTLNAGTQGPTTSTYVFYQGTSMAAPHVAGVASLVLSVKPGLNPYQVTQIIQNTATKFPVGR